MTPPDSMETLEEFKCTGPYCGHETSEDHYIINKDWFESQLQAHGQKEREAEKQTLLKKIEGMKMPYSGKCTTEYCRCYQGASGVCDNSHNIALDQVIKRIEEV